MLYALTFLSEEGKVRFKFDKKCNLLAALEQLLEGESIEGFEEGQTKIEIETPTTREK